MRAARLVLLLCLLGVSGPASAGDEIKVVATTSDVASIVQEVGGDRVSVRRIVDGSRDPHHVEILPSYMLHVKRADLFVMVGMQLELWAPGILDGARNRDLVMVDCSRDIEPLEVPVSTSAKGGDLHAGGNPHYWLDPHNGILMAAVIRDALVEIDPDHAADYNARMEDFAHRLEAAIVTWRDALAPLRGTEWVTFHNTWPYWNRAFDLTPAGFVEPKPGVSPSPGHTADMIRLIREHSIRIIGIAPFYDDKVPQQISRETGAVVVPLATSVGGIKGADDYFGLFEANVRALLAAVP